MLYIRKFYVVQNTYIYLSIYIGGTQGHNLNWRVTNMVRNDLGWREAPPQQLFLYKKRDVPKKEESPRLLWSRRNRRRRHEEGRR